MNNVAEQCTVIRHHPEWSNIYNLVFLRWTTHNPPGISKHDLEMASLCDRLAIKGEVTDQQQSQSQNAEKLEMTAQQWCSRIEVWKDNFTVHADCMAVIHATSRQRASIRDQFNYGLCYKHEACMALHKVKVDARKSREQSKNEGWEEHWKGNNAADETIKLARPRLQCVYHKGLGVQRVRASLQETSVGHC